MEIVVENYTKIIKGNCVLNHINYKFFSGNIYGLYGKNGSGKTMLLRAIAGLIYPSQGKVMIDNKIVRKDIDFPENIGIMIETPYFLPHYTGKQNLKLLMSIKGKIKEEDITNALSEVGLDPDDKRKVRKYSLGMKQRLGIAAAIMENPQILLLDEPFNGIDEDSLDDVRRILYKFRNDGRIVILACHDMEELQNLTDEILRMKSGCIE